jgi:hypothetical protein
VKVSPSINTDHDFISIFHSRSLSSLEIFGVITYSNGVVFLDHFSILPVNELSDNFNVSSFNNLYIVASRESFTLNHVRAIFASLTIILKYTVFSFTLELLFRVSAAPSVSAGTYQLSKALLTSF